MSLPATVEVSDASSSALKLSSTATGTSLVGSTVELTVAV